MAAKKPIVAFCYDFDGTLSPKNMQEYSFIEKLGISPLDFWKESTALAEKHDADPILTYMKLMLDKAAASREIKFYRKSFAEYGKGVEFFPGVETWFQRINSYGQDRGVRVQHFIISSGLKEMIEGTSIGKEFDSIFASCFAYEQHGIATWPAVAVNYTSKTQYLFRISKGALDVNEHTVVNQHMSLLTRPIPFSRMVYIGDGDTDVPCMRLVKDKGGHSIAVYPPDARTNHNKRKRKTAKQLLADERVSFIAKADYSEGGHLEMIAKAVIDKGEAEARLTRLREKPFSLAPKMKAVVIASDSSVVGGDSA